MDKIFRNKLHNHASEMPQDMWSRIELGMKEEKKDRGLYFWLGTGLGIFLLLTVTYLAIFQIDFSIPDASLTQNIDIPDNIDNEIPNSIEKSNYNLPHEDKTKSDETLPVISDLDASKKSYEQDSEHSKIFSRKTSHITVSKKNEHAEAVAYLEPDLFDMKEVKESERIQVFNPIDKSSSLDQHSFIKLDQLGIMPLKAEERNFGDPVGCPSFTSRSPLRLYLEMHYSPLSAMKLLSSNSPEIGSEYLALRRNTERSLYSWSAGANIGYISPYNLGFKAGINYEVINERFVYEDPEALRNQTIIVIDTIFNQDGSVTINSDTSVVQVSGFESLQIYNYHKSVEIPLHLSYYFDLERFDFEISGGANLNINYSNRGKIVDPSNEDQWFTNGADNTYKVFRDRLALSWSLSVSAFYDVNEKIQLYARPHFKFHPSSMTVASSPSNQRYAIVGIAAGARYYFSENPNY